MVKVQEFYKQKPTSYPIGAFPTVVVKIMKNSNGLYFFKLSHFLRKKGNEDFLEPKNNTDFNLETLESYIDDYFKNFDDSIVETKPNEFYYYL